MNTITRQEAKNQGLKYYFTGIPCNRGHISPRHTCNSSCSECRRLNCQEFRKVHPYVPKRTKEELEAQKEATRLRRKEKRKQYKQRPEVKQKAREDTLRQYYADPNRKENGRQKMQLWVQKNRARARDNRKRSYVKGRDQLSDAYVKFCICGKARILCPSDIPPMLVESKRAEIRNKRLIKNICENQHV